MIGSVQSASISHTCSSRHPPSIPGSHRQLFSLLIVGFIPLAFWFSQLLFLVMASEPAAASSLIKYISALPPVAGPALRPAAWSLRLADKQNPQPTTCDIYYFHNQTKSVGNHGNQRLANTTALTAGSPSVVQKTLPALSLGEVEIIKFYTDPPLPFNYSVTGDIIGSIWLQSTNFANTTFIVRIFDYNPANGQVIALGALEFILITDGQNEAELVITPPPGASVPSGHRLLFELYARSPILSLNPPTVSFYYDSADRASQFTFCHPTPPILTLSKSGPPAAIAGLPITYTLTVTNSGSLAATNLVMSDTLPPGATYLSGGALIDDKVTWSIATLAPQTSLQQIFVVTASQTITNADYQVTANGNIAVTGAEAVVTVISLPGQPNLTISKSGPSTVFSGEPITYTLTLYNAGDTAATNLVISDTLPAGATYLSGGTLIGNIVTWPVAALAASESLERNFVVTATTTITNEDYRVSADAGVMAAGQEVVTTQIVPRQIYLPILLKSEAQVAETTLVIESTNTGGISLLRVLHADTGNELLQCTNIGNNVTVTCGKFTTVASYRIIATTNKCGLLQGTFNDALPGGTITRKVFCN